MKPNKSDFGKGWPKASNFKRSIRFEVTLFVSAIILALMLITGYVMSDRYVDTVTRGIAEKMLIQARSYSGPAGKLIISMDGPDALLLNNICKKLAADNADIYWAGITNSESEFLAHTDLQKVISSERMKDIRANHLAEILRPDEIFNLGDDTLYVSVPITENEILLGRLHVAASTSSIEKARKDSTVTVASITILMIIFGLPLTMLVLHVRLKPIRTITSHLKNIDFDRISLDIPLKKKDDFGYLAETLKVMGVKLQAAQREQIEKERIARELEIAREIQNSLLPKSNPSAAELDFACAYSSAKEVGGDYYDFIEFDPDHLGIIVADVSGKSLPGMLVMLMTRDIVKAATHSYDNPGKILSAINRKLKENIRPGMFVTMFLGIFEKSTSKFIFASAGHNPLVWFDSVANECRLIKTKGYPLGMMPDKVFLERIESDEIRLSANDLIVQYTDGVNEAQNPEGAEFGLDRFVDLIKDHAACDVNSISDRVLDGLNEFVRNAEQYDDITLLAVKWLGSADMESMKHSEEAKIIDAYNE